MKSLKIIAGSLLLFVFTFRTQAQIIEADSLANYTHYHYYAITYASGAGFSISPKTATGIADISFPYTSTDATTGITTSNIFQFPAQKKYSNVEWRYALLELEYGGLKHFLTYNLFFSNEGYGVNAGYGFIWYFNGLGEHEKNVINKRFVFKASMNVAYYMYGGNTSSNMLSGTIDNTNSTIHVLGHTANPQYTETTYDDDGNEIGTNTYTAKNLDVSYEQQELSLLPRISIGSNPYRRRFKFKNDNIVDVRRRLKVFWELSLGYNIPLYDWGGIELVQNDGSKNGNDNSLSGSPVSLKNKGLTFLYNGKQITTTPFHFSGLYIAFAIRFGKSRCW